jgi:hypothetical protein
MKPNLLLLTDLWGYRQASWQQHYIERLSNAFDITVLDATALAEIDLPESADEAALHQAFIAGGIEMAVRNLVRQAPPTDAIIGCSIGGLIAWKACLAGLPCPHLIAISSTRLRYEHQRPDINMELYFGENDAFRPSSEWFSQMGIPHNLMHGQGHEVYKSPEMATLVSNILTVP